MKEKNVNTNSKTKMQPKISLVLPSYNSVKYIEETLISLQQQNNVDLELIAVDGGSTDGTIDIIHKYGYLFSHIICEPDNGQTDAINKGIQYCTGDIFYWINADDYLEPDVLSLIADEFFKNPFDVLCVQNRHFNNDSKQTIRYSRASYNKTIEETIPYAGMSITLFYNLKKVKPLFSLSENLHYAMDFELYFRFILKYGILGFRYADIPVVTHFREHNDSKTIQQEGSIGYTDLNAIHISMLDQLNAPSFLIDYFSSLEFNGGYNQSWNFERVNKRILFAYYAKRVSMFAYSQGKYKIALRASFFALKSCVKFGKYDWYRLLVLMFFPSFIIKQFRRY